MRASPMRILERGAAALTILIAIPAAAHSLKDLETMLEKREAFFQPIDKPAPDFELQTADGSPVRLAALRDKVVVLHFIYAGCPDICSLHAEKIAEIQDLVNQTPMRDQVRFLSITTDPVNDAPQVLRDYGPLHGLDTANWSFLTTRQGQPEDRTRRLAEAYGHKFTKTESGYQAHGIVTHVIDRYGRWRANFHGLKFQPVNAVMFVNALVNDVHHAAEHREKTWWERVKELF